MPPFYDLECGNCNYERDDVYFSSRKAFENAEKECPQCGETLAKKLAKFNIGRTSVNTSQNTQFNPAANNFQKIEKLKLADGKEIVYLQFNKFKVILVPKKKKTPKINLN